METYVVHRQFKIVSLQFDIISSLAALYWASENNLFLCLWVLLLFFPSRNHLTPFQPAPLSCTHDQGAREVIKKSRVWDQSAGENQTMRGAQQFFALLMVQILWVGEFFVLPERGRPAGRGKIELTEKLWALNFRNSWKKSFVVLQRYSKPLQRLFWVFRKQENLLFGTQLNRFSAKAAFLEGSQLFVKHALEKALLTKNLLITV